MSVRWFSPFLLLAFVAAFLSPTSLRAADAPGRRHALLVGCTRYENLPPERQLQAAPQDVALLREVLCRNFGFTDGDFTILTEAEAEAKANPGLRPTRDNIQRAFRDLALRVQPGDQVVIWLSGHGSVQPLVRAGGSRPDMQNQIFLPADVDKWNGSTAVNAILDHELAEWTRAVISNKKDAFVWVIVDACHSGNLIRGVLPVAHPLVKRVLPSDLQIPVPPRAKGADGPGAGSFATLGLAGADNPQIAAIYACMPWEETIEFRDVDAKGDKRYHGLLTYSICRELLECRRPLTYRELVLRLRNRYSTPQPLAELDRDRLVLGQNKLAIAPFELKKGGSWYIDGGSLHGLTSGSILKVLPPPGESSEPLGYLCLKEVFPLIAYVVPTEPTDRAHPTAALERLPTRGCRCEPVFINYGDPRPTVAVLPAVKVTRKLDAAECRTSRESLAGRQKPNALHGAETSRPYQLTADPTQARWLVCAASETEWYLVAGGGLDMNFDSADEGDWIVRGEGSAYLVPGKGRRTYRIEVIERLDAALERVARVDLLRSLAAAAELAGDNPGRSGPRAEVKLFRVRGPRDSLGEELDLTRPFVPLKRSDLLSCEVVNRGGISFCVTILSIDSDCGITQLYPRPNLLNLPLQENQAVTNVTVELGRGKADGPEQLVVLGTSGSPTVPEGPDFSFLTQSGLPEALRSGADKGPGRRTPRTPLEGLWQDLQRGGRKTKGIQVSGDDYFLLLRSLGTPVGQSAADGARGR